MNKNGRFEFNKDKKEYIKLSKDQDNGFPFLKQNCFPCLNDAEALAGKVDTHYFWQDIYMAKKVIISGVHEHYDIGSRLDGFIAHLLSAGIKVNMIDIRPLPLNIEGLSFVKADATDLDGIADDSLASLSSLHAVEHFGLGRYGDKVDPGAWKKALSSFQKKLKKGGVLYFSVPIGNEQKVMFNAHRIFSPETIVESLPALELVSFAFIHDNKIIETDIKNAELGDYDCGLFVFRK